jgi:hypothetical protein
MKTTKDLKRFQPDPLFLEQLQVNLRENKKKSPFHYGSIISLAASIALLLWFFPAQIEKSSNEKVEFQNMNYLQENFEPTEENLEILSENIPLETEEIILEDELIDEIKTMY